MALRAMTESDAIGRRLLLASMITLTAAILLCARLYYLQLVRGDEFASRGRANFVQRAEIAHSRGMVLDRRDVITERWPLPAVAGRDHTTTVKLAGLRASL